ncbi:MAG TPA: hypothetical protein VHM67_13100 [Gemmatimonadaceae bacterium]|nr:hypothetical protein [Gemmatimonadaceae bacterium]
MLMSIVARRADRRSPVRLAALPVAVATFLLADVAAAQRKNVGEDERLRVFIDCVQIWCDMDFMRTDIPFVDHVRQREAADIHVLVTAERTGSGGSAYMIELLGQGRSAGRSDTLRVVGAVDATDDERRRSLARVIKLGLAPFVASTTLAPRLDVTLATAATTAAAPPARDRWNYWVFRLRGNGFTNGEKSSKFFNGFGSLSANRTTEAWKHSLSVNGDYSESRFTFSSGQFNSYAHGYNVSALTVKSVAPHWSVGGRVSASASTRTNQDLALRAAPALEYNVFPYSENTRRALTFLYSPGITHFSYTTETIFNRTSEMRMTEALQVAYDVKQRWGSINTSLEGSHYFHDTSKWRLQTFTDTDVRLFRGLSLNFFGRAALIRDQLFLPKVGATEQEILLQRRQLATSYQYFAGVGLSYSFGSIYNNVVNTRFNSFGSF